MKDPTESGVQFDREGLDLAFKYFTSSTLTMRLAGIAHINVHINLYNELCNSETVSEMYGQNLANWLIDNNIIAHIFGPNLHVEVSFRFWLCFPEIFTTLVSGDKAKSASTEFPGHGGQTEQRALGHNLGGGPAKALFEAGARSAATSYQTFGGEAGSPLVQTSVSFGA